MSSTPEMLSYLSGGVSIATEVYKPSAAPKGCVVILAYGSDGFIDNSHGPWATNIREDASALSAKGFHALIPDYFLRTGTRANSIDYLQDGALTVARHKSEWQSALADSVTFARALSGVSASRIGFIGYSLGAYLSLRLRAQAKALIAFFPPFMDGIGADVTPGLPVEIHFGDRDPLFPHMEAVNAALRAAGAVVTPHVYPGANHGFTGTDPGNTSARKLSKTEMVTFLERSL